MENRDRYVFLLSLTALIAVVWLNPDPRAYTVIGGTLGAMVTASGKQLLKMGKKWLLKGKR